ncbi:uncharacterized protein HMPREF1541_10475 [Cyphellophora europaea CBS 101466]|uniref:Uncharacterized protein n=1 Tax=Cyphellophora europaea (strain CBS 101466) TaxID=1220924 RepID=W2S6N8_CYPE1|nr:uncharacterized protein HMPREF1541_10475 [Cyphellophora europaea CBS 101466]ETN44295.1 hypothetical protein HMPREF1541_10475 [Cyphellophora europaea CBS 101466]
MTLAATYERFLASPNPLNLSEDASLHYIPTLKSFSEQGPLIRHLEDQNRNVVKTKSNKTISVVEGASSLALETETILEFVSGGGAYLPGLDTFIFDSVATLPMTHIVHFNAQGKITQIRISWDQATLLKQTEVIGTRGKNWPVTDGKHQIQLISSSFSAAPVVPNSPPRGRATDNGSTDRPSSPTKRYIKDPHASSYQELFSPGRDDNGRSESPGTFVAPRASARPPPREMSELFAAGHEDHENTPKGSPKKAIPFNAVAPKGAGSQKFGDIRVFDGQHSKEDKIYRTNPARYDHFDIGDADENDPMQHKSGLNREKRSVPMRAKTDKGGSQWDFIDFVTPAKVNQKIREQDKVNWNYDEESMNQSPGKGGQQKIRRDDETHFELKDDGTPVERHIEPKPRKDAHAHFEFNDEPTPAPRRIIARTNAAMGIYRDVVHDDEEPLAAIDNNVGRGRAFGNHWDMRDTSPEGTKNERPASKQQKSLETHWGVDAVDEPEVRATRSRGGGGGKGFWDF